MIFDIHEFAVPEGANVVEKRIEAGNEQVAIALMQENMYSYKEKSIIRELASNSKDSIKDRDVAKLILTGQAKPEDYFIEREGAMYEPSKWKPDYFNLDYLSDDPTVYITLTKFSNYGILSIKDNGVGLGGDNLRGFFNLNFSTKRCATHVLGAFGLGSKSPFSLVPEYTVVTRYNGYKSEFRSTKGPTIPLTGKFSASGEPNEKRVHTPEHEVMDEEGNTTVISAVYAYWEKTDEKNGLESIIRIPKATIESFINSVESQLMYMPDVKFVVKEGLSEEVRDVKAEILYRDDQCIISNNNLFTKPHLLLGAGDTLINYGPIDFNELEREPKSGSIGIILDSEKITVTPNRETIIWDSKAADEIERVYKHVEDTARKYVDKELKTADEFVKWIHTTAISTSNSLFSSGDSILAAFSGIIKLTNLEELEYFPNPNLKFIRSLERQFKSMVTFHNADSKSSINSAARFNLDEMYYMDESRNQYKHRYLTNTVGNFTYFYLKEDANMDDPYIKELMKYSKLKKYSEVTIPEDVLQAMLDADAIKKAAAQAGNDDEEGSANYTPANVDYVNVHLATYSHFSRYSIRRDEFASDIFKSIASNWYNGDINDCFIVGSINDKYAISRFLVLLEDLTSQASTALRSTDKCMDISESNWKGMIINKKDYAGLPFGKRLVKLFDCYFSSYKNGVLTLSPTLQVRMLLEMISNTTSFEPYKHLWQYELPSNYDNVPFIYRAYRNNSGRLTSFETIIYNILLVNAGIMEGDKQTLLAELDKELPDFIAREVDEITDVKGLDIEFYEDLKENVFGVYDQVELVKNRVLSGVNYELLKDSSLFLSTEHEKVQKGFDPTNKVLLGQAIPDRFKFYMSDRILTRPRRKIINPDVQED